MAFTKPIELIQERLKEIEECLKNCEELVDLNRMQKIRNEYKLSILKLSE
jgi:hypothetical protein